MLTESDIKEVAGSSGSYHGGLLYFKNGNVKWLNFDSNENNFAAQVMGGHRYTIQIDFDDDNELDDYECNCMAFRSYFGACKHIVAVLKVIQDRWQQYFGAGKVNNVPQSTRDLLTYFNTAQVESRGEVSQKTTKIEPTYCFLLVGDKKISWVEFNIGNEKTYVMKDIKKFMEAVYGGYPVEYGKNFTFKPREAVFDDRSRAIFDFIKEIYIDDKQQANWGYYSSPNWAVSNERKLKLNNSNLLKFLEIMENRSFNMRINNDKIAGVKIIAGRPHVKLDVQGVTNGLKLQLDLEDDVYYGLDTDFKYVYHNANIYKPDEIFSKNVLPLMRCFSENKIPEIRIPASEVPGFFSTVLPAFEKIAEVHVDTSLTEKFYREPLEKQVYFDRFGPGVKARIVFKYGEMLINPADAAQAESGVADARILLRATVEENKVLSVFDRHGFEKSNGVYTQVDEDVTYNFLKEGLPELLELAEVFYSDDFKNIKIYHTGRIAAGVKLNTGTDLLEMTLQYENTDPQELIELLSAYKLKKKYHRMKNGAFIPLDSAQFQNAAELVEQLGISDADIRKKVIQLPKYRAMYLDSLAREAVDFHIERNSAFKKMVQDISEPQDMEFAIPDGIQGKLRDYQKTGFKWLKSLSYYGFGGILADDMGLGKTLQIITLILSEKSEENMPSLVIAPTSLVYNWQEEIRKFAPSLSVKVITGQQVERLELLKDVDASDVVVTSYGMMKRDIELYETREFKYCFIDEAQHIKNPNTLNAKAVKRIKAKGYFALTGTPIENTLTELWSIFDFLMPGYLLTHNKFTTRYEKPIVKNADNKALIDLGRHIKPFILRRMKKDVLKELPEKIESKMSNEMTSEQAKIYTAYLMKARKEFEQEISDNGFQKSQIKILSIITRLRQICCHPSLFIENYTGGSGKLDMLLELLEDALAGGHRILLFSQFTSMLALIKEALDAKKTQYHYLDGSTKAEERMRLVNSFNAGENDIFLISLKAGGTGLNLTGADMVIHYDPWWNPAVEDQATDRAYRIGQKNVVQVFKFITKGTLEEKIFDLQQKKKALIDTVIKPGENFLTKMSETEIRKLFEF